MAVVLLEFVKLRNQLLERWFATAAKVGVPDGEGVHAPSQHCQRCSRVSSVDLVPPSGVHNKRLLKQQRPDLIVGCGFAGHEGAIFACKTIVDHNILELLGWKIKEPDRVLSLLRELFRIEQGLHFTIEFCQSRNSTDHPAVSDLPLNYVVGVNVTKKLQSGEVGNSFPTTRSLVLQHFALVLPQFLRVCDTVIEGGGRECCELRFNPGPAALIVWLRCESTLAIDKCPLLLLFWPVNHVRLVSQASPFLRFRLQAHDPFGDHITLLFNRRPRVGENVEVSLGEAPSRHSPPSCSHTQPNRRL
mmetsp:Transcript_44838/g.105145  ORF Transcript_44838/g.105145 Transcript_44838/m.105145 type:complete len:303 (-) Transcript_44838:14-922(-)